jgi:hypothetical protein
MQSHKQYVRQALGNPPQRLVVEAEQQFRRQLCDAWKAPWENTHKEVLWRLAVNGVPGAGGYDICFRSACPCGFSLSEHQYRAKNSTVHRQHAFWDCPAAQAVRAELQRVLGVIQLQQWHLWLARAPSPTVQQPVWTIVSLAALEAMDFSRRCMWSLFKDEGNVYSRDQLLAVVSQKSVAQFWLLLHDFASESRPAEWSGWHTVGDNHLFLSVTVQIPKKPVVRVARPV